MGLNDTPVSERTVIGFIGNRNAGKSTLVNAFTGQKVSITSEVKGTTTDPVYKTMELLPLGPVQIVDTPGFDDEGNVGELRVKSCFNAIRKMDIAILVVDFSLFSEDNELVKLRDDSEEVLKFVGENNISLMMVLNLKDDDLSLEDNRLTDTINKLKVSFNCPHVFAVNALKGEGVEKLKTTVAQIGIEMKNVAIERSLLPSFLKENDTVILVVPIDKSAPKGRLILPQQQVIRALIDKRITAVITEPIHLSDTLAKLNNKVDLVITDSQVFGQVEKVLPHDIKLTSFSILLANYKGDLKWQKQGAKVLDELVAGDKILIAEGCTHHRQCEDIGTVKLPRMIREHTTPDLQIDFVSGKDFPENLSQYKLIVHCGGCMLNAKEMEYRIRAARKANVPITNYGIAMAKLNGILDRATGVFDE